MMIRREIAALLPLLLSPLDEGEEKEVEHEDEAEEEVFPTRPLKDAEDERSWCCAQDAIFVLFKPFSLALVRLFLFVCVGDSKKNLITKDKKNNQKAQRENCFCTLRFSTVFCTRERICISAKRAAIAKLSLSFYSVCFSFVGVYRFITKTDTYQRECSFF